MSEVNESCAGCSSHRGLGLSSRVLVESGHQVPSAPHRHFLKSLGREIHLCKAVFKLEELMALFRHTYEKHCQMIGAGDRLGQRHCDTGV